MSRNLYLGFGAGLLAGVLGTIGLTGGHVLPRAMAQVAAPVSPTQRYHLSAWAYPGSTGVAPEHGAYILDGQTGKVWQVSRSSAPQAIGKVD
jgi:hypothetical protein